MKIFYIKKYFIFLYVFSLLFFSVSLYAKKDTKTSSPSDGICAKIEGVTSTDPFKQYKDECVQKCNSTASDDATVKFKEDNKETCTKLKCPTGSTCTGVIDNTKVNNLIDSLKKATEGSFSPDDFTGNKKYAFDLNFDTTVFKDLFSQSASPFNLRTANYKILNEGGDTQSAAEKSGKPEKPQKPEKPEKPEKPKHISSGKRPNKILVNPEGYLTDPSGKVILKNGYPIKVPIVPQEGAINKPLKINEKGELLDEKDKPILKEGNPIKIEDTEVTFLEANAPQEIIRKTATQIIISAFNDEDLNAVPENEKKGILFKEVQKLREKWLNVDLKNGTEEFDKDKFESYSSDKATLAHDIYRLYKEEHEGFREAFKKTDKKAIKKEFKKAYKQFIQENLHVKVKNDGTLKEGEKNIQVSISLTEEPIDVVSIEEISGNPLLNKGIFSRLSKYVDVQLGIQNNHNLVSLGFAEIYINIPPKEGVKTLANKVAIHRVGGILTALAKQIQKAKTLHLFSEAGLVEGTLGEHLSNQLKEQLQKSDKIINPLLSITVDTAKNIVIDTPIAKDKFSDYVITGILRRAHNAKALTDAELGPQGSQGPSDHGPIAPPPGGVIPAGPIAPPPAGPIPPDDDDEEAPVDVGVLDHDAAEKGFKQGIPVLDATPQTLDYSIFLELVIYEKSKTPKDRIQTVYNYFQDLVKEVKVVQAEVPAGNNHLLGFDASTPLKDEPKPCPPINNTLDNAALKTFLGEPANIGCRALLKVKGKIARIGSHKPRFSLAKPFVDMQPIYHQVTPLIKRLVQINKFSPQVFTHNPGAGLINDNIGFGLVLQGDNLASTNANALVRRYFIQLDQAEGYYITRTFTGS